MAGLSTSPLDSLLLGEPIFHQRRRVSSGRTPTTNGEVSPYKSESEDEMFPKCEIYAMVQNAHAIKKPCYRKSYPPGDSSSSIKPVQEEKMYIKSEFTIQAVSAPDPGGDPGFVPTIVPGLSTCPCPLIMKSLRWGCEHRLMFHEIHVDKDEDVELSNLVNHTPFIARREDTIPEDTGTQSAALSVSAQAPNSVLRGGFAGNTQPGRDHPESNRSGCPASGFLFTEVLVHSGHTTRLSGPLDPAFKPPPCPSASNSGDNGVRNEGRGRHAAGMHESCSSSGQGGLGFEFGSYSGSEFMPDVPGLVGQFNSFQENLTLGGETMLRERYNQISMAANEIGYYLVPIQKQLQHAQAQFFSQPAHPHPSHVPIQYEHTFSAPPASHSGVLGPMDAPLHGPLPVTDLGFPEDLFGPPYNIHPLRNSLSVRPASEPIVPQPSLSTPARALQHRRPDLTQQPRGPSSTEAIGAIISSSGSQHLTTTRPAQPSGKVSSQKVNRKVSNKTCPNCNQTFSRKYELEDHMARYAGTKKQEATANCLAFKDIAVQSVKGRTVHERI
ncbi:hypothetical protein BDV93DRAFT_544590 [Ceratobasidium sp. AG-I]|nr:hypothetical protein BDV93DRAFT_544590 [Ceratobasidium sp. AG-I]